MKDLGNLEAVYEVRHNQGTTSISTAFNGTGHKANALPSGMNRPVSLQNMCVGGNIARCTQDCRSQNGLCRFDSY